VGYRKNRVGYRPCCGNTAFDAARGPIGPFSRRTYRPMEPQDRDAGGGWDHRPGLVVARIPVLGGFDADLAFVRRYGGKGNRRDFPLACQPGLDLLNGS
jgi:hypothetical protein